MAPFKLYDRLDIISFLKASYGIKCERFEPAEVGLDNSVFFVFTEQQAKPRYVLKVVETRSQDAITHAVHISNQVPAFTSVKYELSAHSHQPISTFQGKPAYVMNYLDGRELQVETEADVVRVAEFMARFHQQNVRYDQGAVEREARRCLSQIQTYWTRSVQEGTAESFPTRKRSYDRYMQLVTADRGERMLDLMKGAILNVGLTHGDFNRLNILVLPDRTMSLIDFDNASEEGFQLYDHLQFLSKGVFAKDPSFLRAFAFTYFQSLQGSEPSDGIVDAYCRSMEAWLCVISIMFLLSTDYYCFEVGKFSPEWNSLHATLILNELQASFEASIEDVTSDIPL